MKSTVPKPSTPEPAGVYQLHAVYRYCADTLTVVYDGAARCRMAVEVAPDLFGNADPHYIPVRPCVDGTHVLPHGWRWADATDPMPAEDHRPLGVHPLDRHHPEGLCEIVCSCETVSIGDSYTTALGEYGRHLKAAGWLPLPVNAESAA
jgi:hypothetical protein